MSNDISQKLLDSLCEQARTLAANLRGPLHRLTVKAGDHSVEVEWHEVAAGAESVVVAAPRPNAGPAEAEATAAALSGHAIVAPLVGVFYLAPEPGADPFVNEGDVVEPGQEVAIIEAMKIMNRVEADRAGRIAKILPANGDMVEFGQELMIIEPLDAAVLAQGGDPLEPPEL